MKIDLKNIDETLKFATEIGKKLRGGEVFELIGDVGAGKTTFTKGLAEGLSVFDDVQSPTFTVSRVYEARDELELHHYDFYRLEDPGIMRYDIAESTDDPKVITVVEWAETVADVLPKGRIVLKLGFGETESGRFIDIENPSEGIKEAYVTWNQNR